MRIVRRLGKLLNEKCAVKGYVCLCAGLCVRSVHVVCACV